MYAVGVPEMTPVDVLNDSPVGSVPLIAYDDAVTPPPIVGVRLVIAVPTFATTESALYDSEYEATLNVIS